MSRFELMAQAFCCLRAIFLLASQGVNGPSQEKTETPSKCHRWFGVYGCGSRVMCSLTQA